MSNKSLIILGAGGHAGVITDLAEKLDMTIAGYLVDDISRCDTSKLRYPILGIESDYQKFSTSDYTLANGVGSIGNNTDIRTDLFKRFKERGFFFDVLVHPAACVANTAILGEGTILMAGVIVQNGSEVGLNCILNTGAIIDHDCKLGDNVHLATGARLSGTVTIGNNSHVGTGASVIHGISIGDDITVGAGSTVVKNLVESGIYVGVPAKKK